MKLEHAKEVIDTIRGKTDRVILFYSAGKDSIALLDMLSKAGFEKIVCVFMYFVKDLEHINKYLRFAENNYQNVEVIQVPHWNLTHIIRNGLYCASKKIKGLTLQHIDEAIRLRTGINWTLYGMKQTDGLNRMLMLRGYDNEAINFKSQKAYPLSKWKNGDVLRYIKINRLPLPISYGKGQSNGVGFSLDCFLYLRKYYPNDLKKILTAFPLSERIIYEYDNKVSIKERSSKSFSNQARRLQSQKNI